MDSGERVGREERGSRTQSRSYPWPVGQEKPQGRGCHRRDHQEGGAARKREWCPCRMASSWRRKLFFYLHCALPHTGALPCTNNGNTEIPIQFS